MIRKALLLVSGTVTGLIGVLAYNPPNIENQFATGASPKQEVPVETPTPSSVETKPSNAPVAKPKPTKSSKSAATPAADGVSGTFTGNVAQTKYGPLEVQIVVSNGKITNAEALQYPSRDRKSIQIAEQVIPWLIQETVNQQSTSIMSIGGATITSNAWKSSLASALQKAGL